MRMGSALGWVSAAAALAVGTLLAWFSLTSLPHTNQQLGVFWGAWGVVAGATFSAIAAINHRLRQGKRMVGLEALKTRIPHHYQSPSLSRLPPLRQIQLIVEARRTAAFSWHVAGVLFLPDRD